MTWKWAIFSYLILWWIMLFTVLPLWVTPPRECTPEQYAAAPEKTYLRRKILLNSVITAVVVLAIHLVLKSGLIPLRDTI